MSITAEVAIRLAHRVLDSLGQTYVADPETYSKRGRQDDPGLRSGEIKESIDDMRACLSRDWSKARSPWNRTSEMVAKLLILGLQDPSSYESLLGKTRNYAPLTKWDGLHRLSNVIRGLTDDHDYCLHEGRMVFETGQRLTNIGEVTDTVDAYLEPLAEFLIEEDMENEAQPRVRPLPQEPGFRF